mmetsp:Transcript_79888/g.226147  ORF Transcript_79888/g.226147 Transcript_79888/m.226147 type:complete len:208 (+) Transcript_79888:553-1176(+)
MSTASLTKKLGKPSVSRCGFCSRRWILLGHSQCMTMRIHFMKPARPALASVCPMLDFDEVERTAVKRGFRLYRRLKAPTSMGSPSDVPVPWHSKQSISGGSILTSSSTERMALSCAGPLGAERLALRPSWLSPLPASMPYTSSDQGRSFQTQPVAPSDRPKPSAPLSNVKERPMNDSALVEQFPMKTFGVVFMLTPQTRKDSTGSCG